MAKKNNGKGFKTPDLSDMKQVDSAELKALGISSAKQKEILSKLGSPSNKFVGSKAEPPKELQGFEHMNPFPYVFKSKYDFKFAKNRELIFRNLMDAQKLIDEHNLRTPEQDGGITSVVLMGTARENLDTGEMTTYVPPHAWEEYKHFTTVWLPKQLEEIWKIWRLEPANKYISESWINVHPKGAYTEEHDHQNVTVAMACYFQVPPNGGRLMMRNPMQAYKYSEPVHHTYWDKNPDTGDDMSWAYIPVETNDVVFFPGWIRHKTEPNQSDHDRIMMSCNVRYEFKRRRSLTGMQNLPEVGKEEFSIEDRVTSRMDYDKSIFN